MLAYTVLSLALVSFAGARHTHEEHKDSQDCSKGHLDETEVYFNFFTREQFLRNQKFYHVGQELNSSYHHVKKVTKIIVHGSGYNSANPDTKKMARYYLQTEDVNVIVVDWSKFSMVCDAKSNIVTIPHVVGHALHILLKTLQARGADPITFHIIGWGIGAHIAGVAGKMMHPQMLGRITALDPTKTDEYHGAAQLETGDAFYVDVIHTSSQSHSKYGQIGLVRFYPNGGKGGQPGCKPEEDPACSREMSVKYFIASIMMPSALQGQMCDSYENYQAGKCSGNPVNSMGEYADPKYPGDFYLDLNEDSLKQLAF